MTNAERIKLWGDC